MGLSSSSVAEYNLHKLRALGYIDWEPGLVRTMHAKVALGDVSKEGGEPC